MIIPTTSLSQGEGVKPVLQIFVSNFHQIPMHKQLILFQTIVKTISVSEYLTPLLVLFFGKHVQDSQIPSPENIQRTHIPTFCHDLCNDLDVIQVTKSLEQLTSFGCLKDKSFTEYYDHR